MLKHIKMLVMALFCFASVAHAENIILSPGFESGAANWHQSSTRGYATILYSTGSGHNGSNGYAFLCNYDNAVEAIDQDVTLPAAASSITLDFYYKISTNETTTTSIYDHFYVLVLDPPTDTQNPIVMMELSNLNKSAGWLHSNIIDLSAFKGKTIRLMMMGDTDGKNLTAFRIDDVNLNVVVPSDTAAPVISQFIIPPTSTSLTIPITTLTASDNTGVTGYLITESSSKPSATATGWTTIAPTTFTASGAGSKDLYAWAKDAAENVSLPVLAKVMITLPQPVNGACGSSNDGTFPVAPTTNLCSIGTASTLTGTGPWNWTCPGSNGGTTANCLAYFQPVPVNGQCGNAAGKPFIAAPVADLCVSGTASAVAKGDSWSWSCNGLNGGSSISCTAIIAAVQQNPATAVTDMTWQHIGPSGANTYCFAIDPTNNQTIYAGTYAGGVYKSLNGGASWMPANSGMAPGTGVKGIVFDPSNTQIMYAGSKSGVFKTTNGGESWTELNNGLTTTNDKDINTLIMDPTNSQMMYIGTQGSGVLKTTDGGNSWVAITNGLVPATGDYYVYALAIDPANPQVIYAGSGTIYGGKVFKSTNGGAAWSVTGNGISGRVYTLVIDPSNSNILYAGTMHYEEKVGGISQTITVGGIYKTTDGAVTWTHITTGNALSTASILAMAIDNTTGQTIYAGAYLQGIYKSTDRGASWTQVNNGLIKTDVYAIAIDPADVQTIYAGTYAGGVFKSINGGQSWSPVGDGLTNAYVETLALDPVNAQTIYSGMQFNSLFKTTDAGTSWGAIGNSLPYTYGSVKFIVVDPSNRQTVYASIYNATTFTYSLYKSTDGGATWIVANSGMSAMAYSLVIDPVSSQTIYAGTNGGGVFKAPVGGTTWVAANSGLTDLRVISLTLNRSNNQIIYAGSYGKIFKSLNGGGTWSSVSNGLPTRWIKALVINPSNSQSIYAGADGGGVYRTSDGGASWNAVNSGLTNLKITSLVIDPTNTQIIYAGTYGGGVFRTLNGGISWSAMSANLYDLFVTSLAIDPLNNKLVYAGTWGSGVYKTLTSDDVPVLSGSSSPTFTEGASVNFQIASSGWPAPIFSLSGTLPGGLTFDATTGAISGTPGSGTAGTYPLIMTAANGIPPDAVRGVTLTVLPASSLAAGIVSPVKGSALPSLSGITGTASGTGLSKVEVQITDGIYYLQSNGTFATTPTWLTASGTVSWSLNTSVVTWRESITYTIQARASNGAISAPSSSTFTIQVPTSKTGTTISILTPDTLRAGDSTTLSGSLVKSDTSAVTGQPVTLIIAPPSTTATPNPAPIITSLTTDSSGSFTSDILSLFAVPGIYTVQARFEGNATLAASFASQVMGVTSQSGYAIIITGKASDSSLLDMHIASTDTIYSILVNKRGFLPENITYLKSTTTAPVTRQQLQEAITVWARGKITAAPAPLYLIMIDHGSGSGFLLDTETLTPDQLKGYLDTLESDPQIIASGTLTTHNRIIMIGSCYSGIFTKLSKPGRVVITSANTNEQSIAGFSIYNSGSNTTYYGGEYFIDAIFSYMGRGDSLRDAFIQSRDMVELRDPRKVPAATHAGVYDTLAQHPLLDDNGDGKASYLIDTDGWLAANLRLGVGIRSLGNPADITAVTDTTNIPATQTGDIPLWLRVNDNGRIAKAWMEIRTPVTTVTTSTTGQVIPHLITLPLYYDGLQWNGSYTFPNAGKYNILYYTQDNQTNDIAPAKNSVAYRQLTNNPAPAGFNLTSPNDGDALSGMFTLAWQEVKSPNKVTYTLHVSTDQNFTTEVYKEENIPQAATFMPRDALKNPKTGQYFCQNGDSYCYWKVQAIDIYGATTESDTRSFTIISTNALPGIIKGIIYSDLDYSRITTASLTAIIDGSNINIPVTNGVFFLAANTGSVSIAGTAQGYQNVASDVNVLAGEVTTLNIGMAAVDAPTYTITATPGGNGAIVCDPASVPEGSGSACTITANTDFRLLTLMDNGSDVTSQVTNNRYILLNIASNHAITATFGDMTKPAGSVSAGGAYTKAGTVTLTLSATDITGLSGMMFSWDGGVTWGAEEPYGTTKSWNMGTSDGLKTVYVKFKDTAGNWSDSYTASIILDTIPPVTTASPVGRTYDAAQSVTLSANEGATIYYTTDGSVPLQTSAVYSGPISVPSTAPMTLKFFARDAAGNIESVKTEIYSFDTTKPGDLDGSGQVDIADAIIALQVTARRPLEITLHLENDVNDDGKIGMADVIYILQRIAGTRAH